MKDNATIKQNFNRVDLSPFVNANSTSKTYLSFFIALIPQLILLFTTKSFNNIIIIITAIFACNAADFFNYIEKKNFSFSIISNTLNGLLIGFFIPANYPILSVFFITFFVMLTVKYCFGSTNVSWINPVVICVIICWFIGQVNFPDFLITKDMFLQKNPSMILIQDGVFPIYSFDEGITTFLNDSIFSLFGISLPQGYISLLWDTQSSIPAFRFNFLTLCSSIVLISLELIHSKISFSFLLSFSILVKFCTPLFTGGIPMEGDIILAIFSSGIIFIAFFMLQYFGTTPLSNKGKIIYGLLAGLIAFIFNGCGTSPIGACITVLFMNIISPIIQYIENKNKRNRIEILMRNEDVRNS